MIQHFPHLAVCYFVAHPVDGGLVVVRLHQRHDTAGPLGDASVVDGILVEPPEEAFDAARLLQLVLEVVVFPNLEEKLFEGHGDLFAIKCSTYQ